jgi:hypothetical protein
MLKKAISTALVAVLSIAASPLRADEGMWLPMLIARLNQTSLQRMGLKLTPEEIYSVNNASLKDAIVSMGGFCTGEMISPNGLMLTNHHCGYDAIRSNSSVQNDYLTRGFWARSYNDELPNPGLFVSFLVRMDDVTAQVLDAVKGIDSESARNAKIAEIGREISDKAKEGTHYKAEVKSFYAGNEFYLFVYEVFNDVRLVGAPPSAIGKFGGDTDNWMWPRHTGDFALFRVYAGPDGKPAEYSPNNVPLKPKHFLPISLDGVKEGDFAMTFGYPGSTERYLSSWGVEQAITKRNPTIVEIRDVLLDVMRRDMKASDAVRIQYASKFAQVANYWKYFIGQTEQLQRLNVKAEKEKLEKQFENWLVRNPDKSVLYGETLDMLRRGYAMRDNTVVGGTYVVEAGLRGADVVLFAYRTSQQLEAMMAMANGAERDALRDQIKAAADEFFGETNMATDRKLFVAAHELYGKKVPREQQPEYMRKLGNMDGKWQSYANNLYNKSIFTDQARFNAFLNKPSKKTLDADGVRIVANDLITLYRGQATLNAEANELIAKGNRLFQAGLREMQPDKDFYPDANSTMRASFGQIRDYEPRDGVRYKYYTTLDGIIAKENPNDDEFIVPEGIKKLWNAKDYGRYAEKDGTLRVNFISTNDITGGNSGSPVINGKGELIGLAFDGNWEAMSGDINFEPAVQRTISVDIRYVLWVIEKYAGVKSLVDEMTLVGGTPVRTEPNARPTRDGARERDGRNDKSAPPIPTEISPLREKQRQQQTTPPRR